MGFRGSGGSDEFFGFERIPKVKKKRGKKEQIVYFIQEGEEGSIKIGISSNVKNRLRIMQTANPRKLRVLATEPGGKKREDYLHAKFYHIKDARRQDKGVLKGEWFYPELELLEYIEQVKTGLFEFTEQKGKGFR